MKLTNVLRDAFVRQAMADVPSIDYDEKIRSEAMKLAVAALPPKVRAIWNDKALREHVATFYCVVGGVGLNLPGAREKKDEIKDPLDGVIAAREAQRQKHEELRRKLRAVAYSATTRKALADMLPEFAKYLPADEATACRTVPAVANVVAEFAAAGWPAGKTAPAPRAAVVDPSRD